MMDHVEIKNAMEDLSRAMLGKGLVNPVTQFHIDPFELGLVYLHWADPNSTYGITEIIRDEPEVAIALAMEFITGLPSPEEAKRQQFMTALGRVIDMGRENGIEVDFINPLTDTMKRLSENAITHRP